MNLAIGDSTYHVDRILLCFLMQFCWTMVVNLGSICDNKAKKDVFGMTGLSLIPLPIILALFGDWFAVLMFVIPAAIACGVALRARRWVGFPFTLATIGCFCLLALGLSVIGYRTGNVGITVLSVAALFIFPAGLASDKSFRNRVEELPRRAYRPSYEYDDGGCGFGDDGGAWGRSRRSGGF